jgi:hypothetical protein
MRSELALRVKKSFEDGMGRRCPCFSRLGHAPYKGTVLFRWDPGDELSFFVLWLPHPKSDFFTIEIAWTTGGAWPADHFTMDPEDPPDDGAVRLRLSRLWDNKDPWWEIVPEPSVFDDIEAWLAEPPPVDELGERTVRLVERALDRLVDDGLRYGRQVAKSRGVSLPKDAAG